MALYGHTCMKDCMMFRMPMQPGGSGGTIPCRLPPIWLQKQGVGEPHRPLSIVLRILPCEGPVPGRRSREQVARLQRRGNEGSKKTRCSPQLGGACQCHLHVRQMAHRTLPSPCRSRRMASTAAMRSPIHRMTGTAIELPSALYRGPSAAGLPRYSTSV